MIKVVGRTNPFLVTIATDTYPFQIDDFYQINDEANNNPICRIIKSESVSSQILDVIEKDISQDIIGYFGNKSNIYIAKAKIENYIKKPIKSGVDVVYPTFEKIKPFTIKPKIEDSFIIGEINGTNTFMDSVPSIYKDLFMVRKENKMQKQTSIPFLFDYKKLSEAPHMGLFGGSGSGKTFALKVITEECMKKKIPLIIFDPHLEMNFTKSRENLDDKYKHDFNNNFKIFVIGKNIGINFCEIQTDELINIMEFAGDMSGAMSNFMREIHQVGDSFMYLKSKIKKLLNMSELNESRKLDKKSLSKDDLDLWERYSSSIPGSGTLIAVSWRLSSLEQEGVFNCDINDIKNSLMQQKTCIIRGQMKALNIVGSYLLSKLYNTRKDFVDSSEYGKDSEPFLPFMVAMDEAHIFCPKNNTKSPIKTILRTIAQEGRKYGIFEIMATQRPSLLDETIVAQMSTKFIFKLSIKEDLMSVEKETDLSKEEIERLPYINSGECFISSSMLGKTMSILVRYNVTADKSKVNPFDELNSQNLSEVQEYLLEILPINTINMSSKLEDINKKFNKIFTTTDLISELETLVSQNKITKDKTPLGNSYLR